MCSKGYWGARRRFSRTPRGYLTMASAEAQKVFTPGRAVEFPPDRMIFGRSAAMLSLRDRVDKVAAANVPVLIQGESGTGKGVLARYLHTRSDAAARPFVKVNCAAIPGTLLESEMFGYEKGAFTGAYSAKQGRVEMAEGGTLFLDGIDEMDLGLQAKLLQLLQDGHFCRIGGREDIAVRIRVICATNRPLEREVAGGRFRQDLYYRINVVNLELPLLRSRSEDIPELVDYFLDLHQKRHNATVRDISPELLRLLERHAWPGNIRELQNLIERYVILGTDEAIGAELLQWDRTHIIPELPER